MAIAGALVLAGCWMSSVSSSCAVITTALAILMPILIGMIIFFWAMGVTFALYIPLIPYLVFTFTALGWMMLVIETVVAAPIVALGVVTPAQDVMSRASTSVMLITNVFLRPSLMIVGFVAAAQLLLAAFKMVNFSFVGSLQAAMGNIGLFGSIAVVTLYVGVMTTIVNEVCSLIYVLPDKVIRWIGGHAEQSSVERAMGEAQRAAESGAKSGSEVMKHSAAAVKAGGKAGMKRQKGKNQENENADNNQADELQMGPGAGPGGGGAGGGGAGGPAGGGGAGGGGAGGGGAGGGGAGPGAAAGGRGAGNAPVLISRSRGVGGGDLPEGGGANPGGGGGDNAGGGGNAGGGAGGGNV